MDIPTSQDGWTWRPLTAADSTSLHELHQVFETEHDLGFRTSLDEVIYDLNDPIRQLSSDSVVAIDADGRFGAVALVSTKSSDVKHRAFVFTLGRPGMSHLEDECIRWGEGRAREMLRGLPNRERVIRAWAEGVMPSRIEQYGRHGFAVARYFVEMSRPLSIAIPDVALPAEAEIIQWDRELDDDALDALNAAFIDHWGTVPMTKENWQRELEYPGVRLDLSTLVVVDDEVVALSLVGMYPEDWDITGRREAWIDRLGTVRWWRQKGLATALLADAMHRFKRVGLDYAALGVDAESPTGAFGLYTRAGFEEIRRSVALVKPW